MDAGTLELRMLGGLDVRRGGQSLAQPPSKKTRALLAYLALTGRAHRRDALCSLLWDVTDDPRGALRWSLSKLRKQVDDERVTRLQTDGERVALELAGATVDVLEMRSALSEAKLASAPIALLEAWSARCNGAVLEGLDLPDFDGYQAWLVAEREQTRRLHANVLRELVQRHAASPDRALAHANAWIGVDPMNAQARLSALRLALASDQGELAKRQFQAARRLFAELDPAKEAQLIAGWQALHSAQRTAATSTAREVEPGVGPALEVEPGVGPAREVERGLAPAREVERGVGLSREVERGVGLSREVERGLAPSREVERGVGLSREVERGLAPSREVERGLAPSREVERGLAPSRESRPSVNPSRIPLIGREQEHAELAAALARVTRKRRAELVLLTGEPGIGKSRLIDEVLGECRAQGNAVLDGAAFEGETGRPYGPWIDALRKLSRTRLDDAARQKMAPLLEVPDTQASSREALFAAVVDVLTGLAATHAPVLVVLDDVHWLDEGSAELLHYTARMQREQPVLFVLAARDAELHDQPSVLRVLRSLRRDLELRELALPALPAAATRRLLEWVDPQLDADAVLVHSGGNPLFALELARAGGSAERARTVADAVRDRVQRLPAEAGEMLRWGAVLGSAIDTRLLAALSSLSAEQQLDGLEELQRHALLRVEPGQGYVFSHELVRGVVYSDLSQPRRTLMHHRAAEALCRLQEESHADFDEDSVAHIARHAALGEGHALAASAYLAAGKRCLKLFASENAAAMVRKGLRHARELAEPARSRSMLSLYEVQLWAKRPEDEAEFCRSVQELAESALQHGCVEHARLGFNMLSYVRWENGQWDEARKQMLIAEQVVRAGEDVDHIEALAEAARCLGLLERDLSHAEALLSEAKARAKQRGYECSALHDADGLLRLHCGELDAADTLFEQARLQARITSHGYAEIQALMNRVQLNLDAGRSERALELAHETLELADKTRDGSEGPYARVLFALAQLALDKDAGSALQRALSELRVADAKHRLAFGLSRAAARYNRAGRTQEAAAMANEALEIARLLERPSDIVLALVELANAQRALGDRAGYARTRALLDVELPNKLSAHAQRARAALNRE
jgi:DNA-binding SARP family transcriptional activator/predicted ATPase